MATRKPLTLRRALQLRERVIRMRDHDAGGDKALADYAEELRRLLSWYVLPLVEIPAGAEHKSCFGCQALVYFGRSSNGRPTPVSLKDPRAFAPTATDPGQGINHFIDCPRAGDYRVPREREREVAAGSGGGSAPDTDRQWRCLGCDFATADTRAASQHQALGHGLLFTSPAYLEQLRHEQGLTPSVADQPDVGAIEEAGGR